MELTAQEIIKYYSLRFQSKFDFRDAKQYFGLAGFKNFKETQVYNAVNIAFTMTIISRILLEKYKIHWAQHGDTRLESIVQNQKIHRISFKIQSN